MFKVEHASFLFDVRLLCPNYRPTMHRDTWTNMATVVKTCMRIRTLTCVNLETIIL